MSKSKIVLITSGIVLSLGGCTTTSAPLSDDFGIAVNQANDQHIVEANALPGAPVMNAKKSKDAIDRYLNDEVKQPKAASGTGGSGGSN